MSKQVFIVLLASILAVAAASGQSLTTENMVLVSGGSFMMGDTLGDCITGIGGGDELPVHLVRLDSYYLGKYLVTFDEYDRFCIQTGHSNPNDEGWGRGNRPTINTSWYDAIGYCNWLSIGEGLHPVYTIVGNTVCVDWRARGYRLPTEAEWEFAAREGGKSVRFGNGHSTAQNDEKYFDINPTYMEPRGGIAGVHRSKLLPVTMFPPNALGLYDMASNVWQWCYDCYEKLYYSISPVDNPKGGTSNGGLRMIRGGSWDNELPVIVRASFRNALVPEGGDDFVVGFRICRSAN